MDCSIERLIQIGTVTAVNENNLKVRVKFHNINMTSDWLSVLQHSGMSISVGVGGNDNPHIHSAVSGQWMPKINDTVVVLFLPIFNSDGFVIGNIGGG